MHLALQIAVHLFTQAQLDGPLQQALKVWQ